MTNLYFSDLLPLQDTEDILKEYPLGLESIHFSISENLDHFSESVRETKQRLRALGNPPLILHGPFLDLNPMCYDRLVREATLTRFSQAYEAASVLGASKIVYHSCMIPSVYFPDGWAERMADFWNHFLEGKAGIPVCMENVLDRYAGPFAEVKTLVPHPDFGICLDLGHVWCYAEDPLSVWTEKLAGMIRHVHIHDNDKSRDLHLQTGAGTLPFSQAVPALKQQNRDLTWTIECSTKQDVLHSISYLLSLI